MRTQPHCYHRTAVILGSHAVLEKHSIVKASEKLIPRAASICSGRHAPDHGGFDCPGSSRSMCPDFDSKSIKTQRRKNNKECQKISRRCQNTFQNGVPKSYKKHNKSDSGPPSAFPAAPNAPQGAPKQGVKMVPQVPKWRHRACQMICFDYSK